MQKEIIATTKAPGAVGSYSQGIAFDNLVFTSGQLPLDPATGKLVEGGIAPSTAQVIKNLQAILEEAGSGLENVIKATVFLKDMGDFAAMNEVYAEFFGGNPPARTTFGVGKLPMDAIVEIEAIAYK